LKITFQADANLKPAIEQGLRRREPAIDFRGAKGIYSDGTPDPEVLRIAAEAGRVLVTGDLRTMATHSKEFVAEYDSPGVLLISSNRTIGQTIDALITFWLDWSAEEVRNQIRWLPYPGVSSD
jgi:hypothetical protein